MALSNYLFILIPNHLRTKTIPLPGTSVASSTPRRPWGVASSLYVVSAMNFTSPVGDGPPVDAASLSGGAYRPPAGPRQRNTRSTTTRQAHDEDHDRDHDCDSLAP